jgi:hypothetical protein
VFGQAGAFTTGTCNLGGLGATTLCDPLGVSIAPVGALFVSDSANNRVLGYSETANPPTNVTAAIEKMDVPPGGTCGTKPCWKVSGTTGFSYKNAAGTTTGLTTMKLKAGSAGTAQVQAAGKGANPPLPTLGLTLPVTVQFVGRDSVSTECWQTAFTMEKKNDATQFSAKGP